jgi:hypothetical protein
MAIDFSAITLEVIDISTNSTPDIYINQNSVTFSKRALEELNYPQNVQFCIDAAHHIFAVRPCKSNETRATPFSKPRAEQTSVLSIGNKNLHEVVTKLMNDYRPGSGTRYKVTGVFDMENKVLYFDMTTAVVSEYRASKG